MNFIKNRWVVLVFLCIVAGGVFKFVVDPFGANDDSQVQDLTIQYHGTNAFRMSHDDILFMFSTDDIAVVIGYNGELTQFNASTGIPLATHHVNVPKDSYVEDAAISTKGDQFALKYDRIIEVRETRDPAKLTQTLELPEFDPDNYFSGPSTLIEFDSSGENLIVYYDIDDSLLLYNIGTGKQQTIQKELPVGVANDLEVLQDGSILLANSESIIKIESAKPFAKVSQVWSQSSRFVVAEGNSLFVVGSEKAPEITGKNFLERLATTSTKNLVMEFEIPSFRLKRRWLCESDRCAIVEGRPVFYRSGGIHLGLANGKTKTLVQCHKSIAELYSSLDKKSVYGVVLGGLCRFDTATWKHHPENYFPFRKDATFAVDDKGTLTAVTANAVFRCKRSEELKRFRSISLPLSPVTAYRSLSADGSVLVFMRRIKGAYALTLDSSSSTSIRLNVPNNCAPRSVTVSTDGQTAAVRYDPMIKLDQKATLKRQIRDATQREFNKGFMAGLGARIAGKPVLDKACAIISLTDNKVLAKGKIDSDALLTAGMSPYLSAENAGLYWVSDRYIGHWEFKEGKSKVSNQPVNVGKVNQQCAFNSSGDVVFRVVSDYYPEDVLAKFYFQSSGESSSTELAIERKGQNYAVAVSDDREHVFLAESDGFQNQISKITREGKRIWQIELPSAVTAMRLSPQGKFLAAKLGDCRYAVVDLLRLNNPSADSKPEPK